MPSRAWTRDELLVAINLYCRIPFGKLHHTNPDIIALAEKLDRTPSSVSMKLCNFASFDPALRARNIEGLNNASRLDEEVWNEFASNWEKSAFESQKRLIQLDYRTKIEPEDQPDDEELERIAGGETEAKRLTRVRLVQSFFRKTVLVNYRNKCSFCGISLKPLLIASHIIPWKDDVERRADPRNGICLCALHDRAFDKGLLGISDDFKILVSRAARMADMPELHRVGLLNIEGKQITPPYRFLPDDAALEFHRRTIFLRSSNE